jgi:effector-binding domain-containing protein
MFPCEIEERAARHTVSIRFRTSADKLPQRLPEVYKAVFEHIGASGGFALPAAFAAYHNNDLQDLDMEAGFPVASPVAGKGEIQPGLLPAGKFAVCHYTGPYQELSSAYEQVMKFIADQGYKASGIMYEWYLNGPETPPEKLKTDILVPVMPVGEPELH